MHKNLIKRSKETGPENTFEKLLHVHVNKAYFGELSHLQKKNVKASPHRIMRGLDARIVLRHPPACTNLWTDDISMRAHIYMLPICTCSCLDDELTCITFRLRFILVFNNN